MSLKKAKETFKAMLDLCYEEDYPELHKELISLNSTTRKNKNYESAMQEILTNISLFTDDFPDDTFSEIERLYEEFLDGEE
jgi:hypothetical protein